MRNAYKLNGIDVTTLIQPGSPPGTSVMVPTYWLAHVTGNTGIHETGRSEAEAIGKLVITLTVNETIRQHNAQAAR